VHAERATVGRVILTTRVGEPPSPTSPAFTSRSAAPQTATSARRARCLPRSFGRRGKPISLPTVSTHGKGSLSVS
jgi:hypothetical protein